MKEEVRSAICLLHSAETVWQLQKRLGVEKHDSDKSHRINNHFLYYLFKFGSLLGNEEFYSLLFPFWFWNLDPATGRKLMFVWMVGMYIGQTMKDHLRQPRPKSPPAVQLETMYLSEFGLPSTHAIVGSCIPFCIAYFEMDRCQFSPWMASLFVLFWAALVCVSRVYVGMHTPFEVLVGLSISIAVMSVFVPNADKLDAWFMNSYLGPVLVTSFCYLCAYVYPRIDKVFTAAWSDSVAILASTSGVLTGQYVEYQIGFVPDYVDHICRLVVPNGFSELFYIIAKTLIGLVVILAIKELTKIAYYQCLSHKLGQSVDDLKITYQCTVEMPGKFLSYYVVGIQVFMTPAIFHIVRSSFL